MKTKSLSELEKQLAAVEKERDELADKYYQAQVSIKRLLVTYARHLNGNWYESTAKECGLEVDSIGFLKEPKARQSLERKGE